MSCQQVRETLWQYIDQELDREAAGRIENHIRGCRDCSARVAFERQLRVLLRRAWDAQAPPELWARVRRLLRML